MTGALCLIYNAAVLAGCGYVVFGLGYSGWWFALAVVVLATPKKYCDCDD